MPFDGIVTRAVTNELQEKIIRGRINKIYQPSETDVVMTIRNKGENHTLLISVHPTYARFHLTETTFSNPSNPPMFCMVLRKHLSGAVIENIEQVGMERIVTFSFKTKNEIGDIQNKKLIIELMGKHSNFMLIDSDKEIIIDSIKHVSFSQNRVRAILPGQSYVSPPSQNKTNPLSIDGESLIQKLDFNAGKLHMQIVEQLTGFSPFIAQEIVHRANFGSPSTYAEKFMEIQTNLLHHDYQPAIYHDKKEDFHVIPITSWNGNKRTFSSVNTMLDSFYSNKAERDVVKQQAKDLYRFITNEKNKNERKLKKHYKTLKEAENADTYQKLGELLTAHLHLVKQGDEEVTVVDYYDPEQKEITITLNPQKTPSENAQSYFRKYQKLKTSKQVVQTEIEKTKQEISYFEQLLQQIDVANKEDIEEIREELREEGYLKKQKQKRNKNKRKLPEPEVYTSSDGTTILVGKNNKQNEYLTMKVASRNEIWLHTKDIPGSHVIIRSDNPSEETLMEAAQIAAYFSKSQQSSSVPVDYTNVKYVKKPNGAKPGFVIYTNQKTVYVTPSQEIVEKLKQ